MSRLDLAKRQLVKKENEVKHLEEVISNEESLLEFDLITTTKRKIKGKSEVLQAFENDYLADGENEVTIIHKGKIFEEDGKLYNKKWGTFKQHYGSARYISHGDKPITGSLGKVIVYVEINPNED